MDATEEWYTPAEFARLFRVSTKTLTRWHQTNKFEEYGIRVSYDENGKRLYNKEDANRVYNEMMGEADVGNQPDAQDP